MSITASVTSPQIAATVAEDGVSVSVAGGSSVSAAVAGGVGPTGLKGYDVSVTVGRSEADYIATGTLGSPTDHSTIQAAINAVIAAGGGTVFIKAGLYFLGATINVTAANVQIIGEGRATELRAVGDYGTVLHCALTPAPTSWPGLSGLVIESIRFESTVERTSGCAIYAQRTHNAVIRDVYLADLTYGVSFGETTPVPPAFWDGIVLDGQDQCLVDNIVGCAVNRAIHVEGYPSMSADFAYDGMVSNCKLWGSPGTRRGTAISIGPHLGGTVLDMNSVNQWEYALYAIHTGGQGGGILVIRGGYAENDTHGYHAVGFDNVITHDLWGSLHVIDCLRTVVSGAARPGAASPIVDVELGDPAVPSAITGLLSPESCECLIFGNANATAVGPWASSVTIRKFDATSVVFEGDSRLTNARTPTAHTHTISDLPVVLEKSSSLGNSGTSTTLSLSAASVQRVTLNASCTFTMPAAVAGATLTLILTQGGSFTASFTGVRWPGSSAPTVTTGAGKIDVIRFVSDGTNWYGSIHQNY